MRKISLIDEFERIATARLGSENSRYDPSFRWKAWLEHGGLVSACSKPDGVQGYESCRRRTDSWNMMLIMEEKQDLWQDELRFHMELLNRSTLHQGQTLKR